MRKDQMPKLAFSKPLIFGDHMCPARFEAIHNVVSMAEILTVTSEAGAFKGGAGLADISMLSDWTRSRQRLKTASNVVICPTSLLTKQSRQRRTC